MRDPCQNKDPYQVYKIFGEYQTSLVNIGYKVAVTNTVAYYTVVLITPVKFFYETVNSSYL
jgi:hypothetical protein